MMMGKQQLRHARESRNPGNISRGLCLIFLDARLRRHDKPQPLKINVANYWFASTWNLSSKRKPL
jgi:hypothetical protein